MTSEHERTKILSLRVRNFRSIRELTIDNLPDIVVFHGENGTGKSNILRAIERAIVWGSNAIGAGSRAESTLIEAEQLPHTTGLFPSDVTAGQSELRIGLCVALGTRANEQLAVDVPRLSKLELECVLQDVGDNKYRFWFERALFNDEINLLAPVSDTESQLLVTLAQQRTKVVEFERYLEQARAQLRGTISAANAESARRQASTLETQIDEQRALIRTSEAGLERLGGAALLRERIGRRLLASNVLTVSREYRQIHGELWQGGAELQELAHFDARHIQRQLFEWSTSADPRRRAGVQAFANRLQRAGLGKRGAVTLVPVIDRTFKQYRTLLAQGDGAQVALEALGSGEQQLFLLMAQLLIEGRPIVQLEEPEAHLHHVLMEQFARELTSMVSPPAGERPEVDQLWIATHHHRFALAEEFFDVSYSTERGTTVERLPRARAAKHFYEPGPLWEVFRSLAETALSPESVVFFDAERKPVTARALDEAIRAEAPIAREWAKQLTEYMVLAMKKSAQKSQAESEKQGAA